MMSDDLLVLFKEFSRLTSLLIRGEDSETGKIYATPNEFHKNIDLIAEKWSICNNQNACIQEMLKHKINMYYNLINHIMGTPGFNVFDIKYYRDRLEINNLKLSKLMDHRHPHGLESDNERSILSDKYYGFLKNYDQEVINQMKAIYMEDYDDFLKRSDSSITIAINLSNERTNDLKQIKI